MYSDRCNFITYEALVADNGGNTRLVCQAYDLDASGKFSGADFVELVSSHTTRRDFISTNQATFGEQLRETGRASIILEMGRSHEETEIRAALGDAFGLAEEVELCRIE
ncbi:MAG: hypothetical protein WBP85_04175 [Terracidiphilus sp.]